MILGIINISQLWNFGYFRAQSHRYRLYSRKGSLWNHTQGKFLVRKDSRVIYEGIAFIRLVTASVTRLGDFLHFRQLFKAFGNN